jgi:hypothetical protein
LRIMYPWLPVSAIEAYDISFKAGDVDPWAVVRTNPQYDAWFPGNMTDDGQPRYAEGQYAAVRESYRDVNRSAGLYNTDIFEDQFTALMEGEVSPAEYEARVSETFDRVISASDEIKQAFNRANGFPITTEGILASALDPGIGDDILSQKIGMAEIIGSGAESGFDVSDIRSREIMGQGIRLDRAREFYQDASSTLPILDMLAARHNDPDDDFDINEFEQAGLFADPFQNRRMRRIISQERSQFGIGASARQTRGALTGLIQE